MTKRLTPDTISSDELTALYNRVDKLEAMVSDGGKELLRLLEEEMKKLRKKLEFEQNMRAALRGVVIEAKSSGSCSRCKEKFQVGSQVFHVSNVGFAIPEHDECVRWLRGRVPVAEEKREKVLSFDLQKNDKE